MLIFWPIHANLSKFFYDPTEYETESECSSVTGRKRRTRPAERKSFANQGQEEDIETDFDFDALMKYRQQGPNEQGQDTRNWMNYLQGEYKSVAVSNISKFVMLCIYERVF